MGLLGVVFADLEYDPGHEREVQNEPDQVRVSDKSFDVMARVSFAYGALPLDILEGFRGKATYGMEIEPVGAEKAYVNLGGGYVGAESEIRQYDFLDASCATAEVGMTFEREVMRGIVRSWMVGISQPVYTIGDDYKPTLSVNYGLKY